MFAALPFIAGLIAVYVIAGWRVGADSRRLDGRDALLAGWTCIALWTVAGTELLSVFHALHTPAIAGWWALLIFLLLGVAVRFRHQRGLIAWSVRPVGWFAWCLAGAFVLILLVTLVTAIVAPPNTRDCLIYHLPRQMHWISQGSVVHYPTHEYRQLVMPPLAEFMGTHLMLLSGGDRLANLPQWFGLVITSAVVSRIAKYLGADRTRQWLAALLVVTIPTAYLWASNAKNGLVLSTWFCAFIGLGVLLVRDPRRDWPTYILTGVIFGLAVMTKGTGIVCSIPLVLLIGVRMIWVCRARAMVIGGVIGLIAIGINAGHFWRNIQVYDSPIWSGKDSKPGSYAPQDVAANLLMNVAIHYGSTDPDTNNVRTERLNAIARSIGADLNDPRIRISGWPHPFSLLHPWKNEDTAGAPVHMTLMWVLFAFAMVFPPPGDRATIRIYIVVCFLALLMFPLTLRMTPPRPRLHLPVLCAAMPLVAVMLQHRPWKWATPLVLAWAATVLWPAAMFNERRPLLTLGTKKSIFVVERDALWFRTLDWMREPTHAMAEEVASLNPRVVGFRRRPAAHAGEYLLQRTLRERLGPDVRFVIVDPPKPFADLPPPHLTPDCVLGDLPGPSQLIHEPSATIYAPTAVHWQSVLFEPIRPDHNRPNLATMIPFIGWDMRGVTHLSYETGPFPTWDIPKVRLGLAPATGIPFHSKGEPVRIRMKVIGSADGMHIDVMVDGDPIGRIEFDTFGQRRTFDEIVPDLAPGQHRLVLKYSAYFYEPQGQRRAIGTAFIRLQLLPSEGGPGAED